MKRNLWMWLGVTLESDETSIEKILNGDKDTLRECVEKGQFRLDGCSYIPAETVSQHNVHYGTHYKVDDIEFKN